ncbi:MAG: UDP-3-O-acyl-N-acetylglucosamine deacetylase [Isosphaeraceae bacterium]
MSSQSRPQRTIASDTEVRGVGFFHGSDVTLRFRPAEPDTGVVFQRTDLPGRPRVLAHVAHVVPTPRRTTIRQGDARVEMVEHVMAGLAGLHVDNCLVEIDAPEAPGCDGSSQPYVEAIEAVGTLEQDRARPVLVIDRPVSVQEGGSVLTAYPSAVPGFGLGYHLDYGADNPIGRQSYFVEVNPRSFIEELAPSRTFVTESEARALREAGIGTRTTEADVLIFGKEGVLGNALRYADECVRHKILDMVGDLALLGKDLQGHVVAHRSGHSLNAALARALDAEFGDAGTARSEGSAGIALPALDIAEILKHLPHRYPFLLVDRIEELDPGLRVAAIKNVTINEPFFQGHWPGDPVMPGVLVLEALAQAAGVMISSAVDLSGKTAMIAAIDEVRLRRKVVPGDQLRLEADCLRLKRSVALIQGRVSVDGQLTAEARFTFVMVDRERPAP